MRVGLHDENRGRRVLLVDYARGDDIVCGRDHSIQNREVLVLRLGASRDRLADKRLLSRWMYRCHKIYEQPPDDVVEVIALDQSSTDWVPKWKTRCVRCNRPFAKKTLKKKKRGRGIMDSITGTRHEFYQCKYCQHEWDRVVTLDGE